MIPMSTRARQPHQDAWSKEHLAQVHSIVLGQALDNNTCRTYSSHLNSYLTFCSLHDFLSYPIHSCFSSEVLDTRSNQIRSTDLIQIHYNKLLHSYPIHIMLNTAYFLHSVYLPFQYISYAHFQLCLLIH